MLTEKTTICLEGGETAAKEIPDTRDAVKCGCVSCGGKEIPADDVETRRKIERYRQRHG